MKSCFSCPKNKELEDFLNKSAFLYEEIAKSRTYLLIDEDSLGGQLAKNDKFAFDVTGDEIIQAAISVIKELQNGLGGRLIAVDCKLVKALHDFYERNQFIMIGHNDDNDLDQFVHFINRKRFDFGKIVEF